MKGSPCGEGLACNCTARQSGRSCAALFGLERLHVKGCFRSSVDVVDTSVLGILLGQHRLGNLPAKNPQALTKNTLLETLP